MRRLPRLDLSRAERAAEAARLAATGLNQRQVAQAMGISRSYANALLNDPSGEKDKVRKRRYGKACQSCGAVTDGSNGRAKAPDYCVACTDRRRAAQHGTRSKYSVGCSCDACRAANRAALRALKDRPVPNHGTASGYNNYGCRCEACTAAWSTYQWMHPEWRERWIKKARGTEPPTHGTQTAYAVYGCRCDVCRDWRRDQSRERRARKREAAA